MLFLFLGLCRNLAGKNKNNGRPGKHEYKTRIPNCQPLIGYLNTQTDNRVLVLLGNSLNKPENQYDSSTIGSN
jgi:hypothetical protein